MAEDTSSQSDLSKARLDEINERLKYLESVVRDQVTRIYALEQRLGMAYRAAPPEAAPPFYGPRAEAPAAPPPPAEEPQPRPSAVSPASASPLPAAGPGLFLPGEVKRVVKRRDGLEARIGGNWFNRIGVIAISIGVAFFLKYAFENQWINQTGRVLIGVMVGLGFLIAGERLRARYPGYAYGLTGGGVLILYLSIFAAYSFYGLIPHLPAFISMAAVTATASLLAARYNALAIAVLGLIGGFLTPVLLSTGVDNQVGLFGYITLLDAGVLALAYSKQWRSLNYMAFASTVLMIAAWMLDYYEPEKLGATVLFLTLFFGIFALLSVVYNVINKRTTTWPDLVLVFANALLYFTTSYELLDNSHHAWLGLFAVMVSAFYVGLGYFAYSRDREDRLLVMTFLGLAFLFLVLAVPIQFDQDWVTMGWAIEGAVMTWVGLRANDKTSRYGALAVFVIAGMHWALVDVWDFSYGANEAFTPLLNRRAISCAVLVVSLAVAAWLYKRYGEALEESERRTFAGLYTLGANFLVVALLSIDINDYFDQTRSPAPAGSRDSIEAGRHDNTKQLALSAIWITYGAAALILGIRRGLASVRWGALALLAVAAAKLLVVDVRYYNASWHALVFNQTFLGFALMIAALASAAWFYSRGDKVDEKERAQLIPALIAAANIFAIVALSAEASGYYEIQLRADPPGADAAEDLQLAKQLSLSVVWTIYGGAMLAVGMLRRNRMLRVMALLLLSATILKVFFWDLSSLDRIYRIISFIVLGAILLGVSFLYQRYRQQLAGLIEGADTESPPGD